MATEPHDTLPRTFGIGIALVVRLVLRARWAPTAAFSTSDSAWWCTDQAVR
jgi:hypothetical protein